MMMKTAGTCLMLAVLLSMLASGCNSTSATMRPDATEYKRHYSYALPQSARTGLGDALRPVARKHNGQSGFRILETGEDSLEMRIAMVRAAEKTLDLQYYAIHDDITSNLLLEAMLRAAKRGVRVRFLLDAISLRDVGQNLSVLNDNPNIEIRVFNPLTTRDQPVFSKLLAYVTDIPHANKRMHNKAMIADNQVAIIGGRNLGDEYFDSDSHVDFKDLDILSAGPITAKISASFDDYWNSRDSFPIQTLYHPKTDPKAIHDIREAMKKQWRASVKTPKGQALVRTPMAARLKNGTLKLVWAKSDLAVDDPFKLKQPERKANSEPLLYMNELLKTTKHEFLMTSPYFVPQDDGVKYFADLVRRGIDVKILTNSLASTDVVIAHIGYTPYRAALVESGIKLYEMKPVGNKRPKQRLFGASAPAYAALHTKVYVMDRKDVMIGSFNFDPRSIELNTEIALVIHSREIADQMIRMFNDSIAPENSYRILLSPKNYAVRKGVVWLTKENGKTVELHYEPKAGAWRKLQSGVMSLLPVEDQL